MNDSGITSQTISYTNKAGFLVKQETPHDADGDGIKEKINKQTFNYDYLGNKIDEKSSRAYDESWINPSTGLPYAWTGKYEYDYAGHMIKSYNIKGDYTSKTYDALGRLISETDVKGNKDNPTYSTTYSYDNLGRLKKNKYHSRK